MDVLIGWPGGDWQATLKLTAGLVVGYLAVIWLATILWSFRDIRQRTRDPISQVVAVVLVTVLPFIAIPIYFVLRPVETLEAAYDRQIEQDAILAELHSVTACPNCRRPAQDDFIVCPHCSTGLREPCAHCSRLLNHVWRHCPYCGTTREPARSASRLRFDEPEAADEQTVEPAEVSAAPEPDRSGSPSVEVEPAVTRSPRAPG